MTRARGFTMLELMISIAIMGVMTTLVIVGFRSGQRSNELLLTARIVSSAIHQMRTSATAGTLVPICSGGPNDKAVCKSGVAPATACPGGVCSTASTVLNTLPQGYGVHLSTDPSLANTVISFADVTGNHLFAANEEITRSPISPGTNVIVSALCVDNACGTTLDVVYAPPGAVMSVNGSTSAGKATITLKDPMSGATRIITVVPATGLVSE